MSAVIHNSYVDFFEIAVESFENKNITVYRKMMVVIINFYKSLLHEIEISNIELNKSEKLYFSQTELEKFYENMYEAVDILALFKNRLKPLEEKDDFFKDLYILVSKLHEEIVENIDLVSTLEAKEIQSIYA